MATVPQAASLLRFDVFELDTRTIGLRKRGMRVPIQGQPLLVLAALLDHAGELVTREELREQIWRADTFVDFDHSLHNAIARLRDVLGDSTENPRYIETLPRRGYRFIAQVEKVPGSGTQGPSKSERTSLPVERMVQTRPRPLSAFVLSAALTVALALWLVPATLHRSNPPSVGSIAVLPLENLSGDSSQDYFADAMTDELITDLAKVGALRVTSRTTVTLYKHTTKSLPEIARELNVDGVVEGSVARSGQRVRITTQLVSASTDQHLWAETYERDLGDALKLQSDVAGAIAQQVRAKLTAEQQAQFWSARAVDPEAYDAYLKGSYYLYNSQITVPGPLNQAKSYFEEAVRKDPEFSRAYSGLANAYTYLVFLVGLSNRVGLSN